MIEICCDWFRLMCCFIHVYYLHRCLKWYALHRGEIGSEKWGRLNLLLCLKFSLGLTGLVIHFKMLFVIPVLLLLSVWVWRWLMEFDLLPNVCDRHIVQCVICDNEGVCNSKRIFANLGKFRNPIDWMITCMQKRW